MFSFGSIPVEIPENKLGFPLASSQKTETIFRQYKIGSITDQKDNPSCVAHSCIALLEAEPIQQRGFMDPEELYRTIRKKGNYSKSVDGLKLPDAVNFLIEKGVAKKDIWTQDPEQVKFHINNTSPVILSIPWYVKMNESAGDGRIKKGGGFLGYHALLAYAYDGLKDRIWLQNQWGKGWAKNGCCYLTMKDFKYLMSGGGLGCALIE